jgi:tetratricopeptide (TPR) repeat protein
MERDTGLPKKILVVDDDVSVAQRIEKPLQSYGVEIFKAPTLEQALNAFDQAMFEVAIVELEFGQMPGLALIQHWRDHENLVKRQTGFIVISGSSRMPTDEQMLRELGDLEFLTKPFSLIQILPYLSRALARKKKSEAIHEFKKKIIAVTMEDNGVEKAANLIKSKLPQLGERGLLMLVEIFQAEGRFAEATEVVDAMIQRSPNDSRALGIKGDLMKEQGRVSDALKLYEQAHKMAPSNMKRLAAMSDCYLKEGNADEAVRAMRPLIKLKPFDVDLKFDLCDDLDQHGHTREAIDLCKDTTSAREVLRYYNNKGVTLSKEGLVKEAISEYKKALKFYPTYKDNYRIMFNIALAYATFKSVDAYAEAENYLAQCVKLAPDFDKAQKMLQNVRKALAKKAG